MWMADSGDGGPLTFITGAKAVRAACAVFSNQYAEPRRPSGNTLSFNAEDPGSIPGLGLR